jgi:two-component system sensor histidine kinase UhpB
MDRLSPLIKLALFEAVYLAACLWGMAWARGAGAALWPPDAVLLAALLLDRPERWWLYILGALPVRVAVLTASPLWLFAGMYLNDSLKALLSAWLLRRTNRDTPWLSTLRDLPLMVLVAAVLSPIISAFAGAAVRSFLGSPFWPVWLQWFLGNSLAMLVLLPALLFTAQGRFRYPLVPAGELASLALGVVLSAWVAFWYAGVTGAYTPIFLYAPIPFLLWAIVRAGPAGAGLSLAVVVLFAMAGADVGRGPFAAYGHAVNLLSVQLFLAVLALPVTALALLSEERRNAQEDLAWSQRELQAQNGQLRMLAGRLITAQEDERRRISRDLHDDIAQRLAIIIATLDGIGFGRPNLATSGGGLEGVRKDVNELANDLHNLSRELYSSTVQHIGLNRALKSWCAQVAAQHQLTIDFTEDGHDTVPLDTSMCLYRVAQEALNNAVKHGRAPHVKVHLTRQSSRASLRIVDYGSGFDMETRSTGIGLASMEERVRFIGGTLSVISTPGYGAEVTAEVPIGPQRGGRATAHAVADPPSVQRDWNPEGIVEETG